MKGLLVVMFVCIMAIHTLYSLYIFIGCAIIFAIIARQQYKTSEQFKEKN